MTTITELTCPLCYYSIKRSTMLEDHIRTIHGREPEQLYCETFNGGIQPVCGCGCGTNIAFKNWRKGYNNARFILGHCGRVESEETKKKRKGSLKEGYDSGR